MHLLLRVCTTSQNPGPWGFEDYQRSPVFHSPWCAVEGWNIKTTFHDLMHVALLGTCRDLFASSLGFWTKQGFYGTGPIANRLRQFSQRMRTDCKAEKILHGWFQQSFPSSILLHFENIGVVWNPLKMASLVSLVIFSGGCDCVFSCQACCVHMENVRRLQVGYP
jgi:hypothetical protein